MRLHGDDPECYVWNRSDAAPDPSLYRGVDYGERMFTTKVDFASTNTIQPIIAAMSIGRPLRRSSTMISGVSARAVPMLVPLLTRLPFTTPNSST